MFAGLGRAVSRVGGCEGETSAALLQAEHVLQSNALECRTEGCCKGNGTKDQAAGPAHAALAHAVVMLLMNTMHEHPGLAGTQNLISPPEAPHPAITHMLLPLLIQKIFLCDRSTQHPEKLS